MSVKHYKVSLSQMLYDILGYDHIQWHPQLIKKFLFFSSFFNKDISMNRNLLTELDLITNFDFITQFQEVSIEHL